MDEREEYTITFFGEIAVQKTFDLRELKAELAEDLVIICCREVGIGPVTRHLFSLYHDPLEPDKEPVWLAPNQRLLNLEWPETRKLEVCIQIFLWLINIFLDSVPIEVQAKLSG